MHGPRLKRLRMDKKLTQKQLAEAVKVTNVSISGYENGKRYPDTDTLQRLADYFNVSTDYLLGRAENPTASSNSSNIERKLTDEEEFQAFANDPELERWYRELPESEEEDLQALRQMWEIIKKNRK